METPAPTIPPNVGPDGEKIVDMTFYDLLGVTGAATDLELKKAYRKMAIKFHPDKNVGDESAAAKFQSISEAFGVLSDSNLRAVYNKQGKNKVVAGAGEEFINDPGAIFGSMFGGKAFFDWIGEISLGKDVSKAFESSTTEEEREEMKENIASVEKAEKETVTSTIEHSKPDPISTSIPEPNRSASPTKTVPKSTATTSTSFTPATAPLPSVSTSTSKLPPPPPASARPARQTPEQRAEAEAYALERQAEKKERIRLLSSKLKDRIRAFVESTNPGGEGDAETERWAARIKEEVMDLSLESFGIELCHLIGQIYMSKAASYIKLHRKSTSNILGVPAFFSRLREKGTFLKEGWSFLSVGLDISSSMSSMKALEAKLAAEDTNGGAEEEMREEMKKIEEEMSGKLLLVAWKGSKFELGTVLRTVVDATLTKEAGVSESTLMLRAKGILLCGAILKSVVADESDAERRQLEQMVEAANQKRKEKKVPVSKVKKAPVTKA